MHTSSCGKGVRKDGLVLQDGQDEIDKRIQSCWYNPMRSETRGSLRLASPRLSLVPQRGWRTIGRVTVGSETIRVEDEGSSITHVGISADRDLTGMHQGQEHHPCIFSCILQLGVGIMGRLTGASDGCRENGQTNLSQLWAIVGKLEEHLHRAWLNFWKRKVMGR